MLTLWSISAELTITCTKYNPAENFLSLKNTKHEFGAKCTCYTYTTNDK